MKQTQQNSKYLLPTMTRIISTPSWSYANPGTSRLKCIVMRIKDKKAGLAKTCEFTILSYVAS